MKVREILEGIEGHVIFETSFEELDRRDPNKQKLRQRVDDILTKQKDFRDAGKHEEADNLNIGLGHLTKRLKATGNVSKHDPLAHLYHPHQRY